jgi:hypothetical protein
MAAGEAAPSAPSAPLCLTLTYFFGMPNRVEEVETNGAKDANGAKSDSSNSKQRLGLLSAKVGAFFLFLDRSYLPIWPRFRLCLGARRPRFLYRTMTSPIIVTLQFRVSDMYPANIPGSRYEALVHSGFSV